MPVQNDNTRGVIGLCLSPVDLAIGKLAAGREKDLSFVTAMLRRGLVTGEGIQAVLGELADTQRQVIRPRLERCRAEAAK